MYLCYIYILNRLLTNFSLCLPYQFYSLQYDEVVVKIRAPLNRLQKQADEHNYPLMLDEKETCRVGARGWTGPRSASSERLPTIKPFLIEHGIDWKLTDLRPYQFIYAPYEQGMCTQRDNNTLLETAV